MDTPKIGLLVCGLGLLMPQPTRAQLNESDTTLVQIRASVTGAVQQGNVDVVTVRSKIDFTLAPTRKLVFKSQNSSLYQAFYAVKADNDIFSRNYFYINPYRRLYPFAIGYVSTNFRRKIDWRYFVGAGATVQLWRTRKNIIKASMSAVYETTRFSALTYNDVTYNGSPTIALWRPTAWLSGWHYLNEGKLRLYYETFYQPSFSNAQNYRWQATIGFDLSVWRELALSALYTHTHEHVVITGIKQTDKLLTMGLSYTLRKPFNP